MLKSLLLVAALAPAITAMADIVPADNQAWYGYYKGTETISGFGVGIADTPTDLSNAMFVDGNDPVYAGNKIVALRFALQGGEHVTGVSGWVATSLTKPATDGQIANVPVPDGTVGEITWNGYYGDFDWIEVMLPEKIDIPAEGLYVGYTLHQDGKTHEALYAGITTSDGIAPDGALYNWEQPFMSGWQSYPGGRMGKLCYQVLVEGDLHKNAVTVSPLGDHITLLGGSTEATINFVNSGLQGVKDIDYVVCTDGVAGQEQHLTLDEPFSILGGEFSLTIPLQADDAAARTAKVVEITKVNGQANEMEAKAEGTLLTVAAESPRKSLLESYTGTWCGWCPRGIVGIEKLVNDFGDAVIPVEAHVTMHDMEDPMAIAAYAEIQDDRRGYPTMVINRTVAADPYAGTSKEFYGIKDDVAAAQAELVEGTIALNAEWANEARTRIKATSNVKFQFNSPEAHYAVGYIVTADSLCSGEPEWVQTNYFTYFAEDEEYQPGTVGYDDFKFYLEQPTEIIEEMYYNDVAIAAFGLKEGLPNTVNAPIQLGVEQTSSYTISLANNELRQDGAPLTVIAFLIDTNTGRMVNADAFAMDGNGNSAIAGLSADGQRTVTARYNLQGQRVDASYKGLTILKYSDGTSAKALVK